MTTTRRLTVTFANVGRAHATFSADLASLSHASLLRAVRPHLLSRDVDFELDTEARTGRVIVGGFREVGTFTWELAP